MSDVAELIRNVGEHSQHGRFLRRRKNSEAAEHAIAAHLRATGWSNVVVTEKHDAPTARDGALGLYSDDGDIFADRDGVRHRIEVKGLLKRAYKFNRERDWQWPVLFFDTVRKVEARGHEISAYYVVSSDRKCAWLVKPSTSRWWFQQWQYAENTGNDEHYACCHLIDADFVRLRGGDGDGG